MNPQTRPAQILVVEDERLIARSIETQLRAIGYEVAGSARTGEEAVRLAADLCPSLILMDINLGAGMDGIQAASTINKRSHIPVVYLTAHSDEATLERAKLTEPHGYILKPFEETDLKTAIEIGLHKGKSDRRVRDNERWLSDTLGSMGDGVIATDTHGRVKFMNSLAEQLTAWTQPDAVGKDVRDVYRLVDARSRSTVPNPVFETLENRRPTESISEAVLIAQDGVERPIDESVAPIKDSNGDMSGAVLVFRDITERNRLKEDQIQEARMDAVGRLAAGIAHDFNNLMTVVTGFSQLLRSDDIPLNSRNRYLELIQDAGLRAARLTQQILAFSRRQTLFPVVLDLNDCVRDVARIVERMIDENIELIIETAPGLGSIKADQTQIGQVILNLAINARDSMPKGGKLTISTSRVQLDERAARRFDGLKPGVFARLTVNDTGEGVSATDLTHIFEPFNSPNVEVGASGLLLASVFGIVKQSGGDISVESVIGLGTVYRVYLPLVSVENNLKPNLPEKDDKKHTETILVVDDEGAIRTMLRLFLQRSGYKILEAADGKSALSVAENHVGPIHLLLTDLVMPRMDGRVLAETISINRPEMQILFMSGYTEDELVRQRMADGSSHFIHKPFAISAMSKKIREVLGRTKANL